MLPSDSESSVVNDAPPRRDSISLAFLFYVMTLSAILAACVRMVGGNEFATWPIIWVSMVGFGVNCMITGVIVAYQQSRHGSAAVIGGIIGVVLGVLAGLATLIPTSSYRELIWIAFAGSWVLIVIMLILARFQRQPHL